MRKSNLQNWTENINLKTCVTRKVRHVIHWFVFWKMKIIAAEDPSYGFAVDKGTPEFNLTMEFETAQIQPVHDVCAGVDVMAAW